MFGSKKDKQGGLKSRLWPWSRKSDAAEQSRTDEPTQLVETVVTESEQIAPPPASIVDTDTISPAEKATAESTAPTTAQTSPEQPQVEAEQVETVVEPAATEADQDVDTVKAESVVTEPSEPEASEVPKAPQALEQPKAPEQAKAQEAPKAVAPEPPAPVVPQDTPVAEKTTGEESRAGFFSRMKSGLAKTRASLVDGVATIFIGQKEIDDDLLEELETQLLVSDVGMEATSKIIGNLTQRVAYKELANADALISALKTELTQILEPANKPLVIDESATPFVILVVGVNGVGKTTTIGKMARQFQMEGRKVMLAAGDTFRAAAVEQLQVWGERNDIPVIAQHTGADSASVLFDAFQAAKARKMDVLIADTAGRLHNKDHLMEELKKVKRVLNKIDPNAPHEVLLVVDAGTGQNAINQACLFNEAVGLTGLALTKLDGTAKGGVTFALSQQMQLPIRFLGVGEQITDLRPFDAAEFVDALFADLNT